MQMIEVAQFKRAGDTRRMLVGGRDDVVVVREELSGPSTLVAYGEESKTLSARFTGEALGTLLAQGGFLGGFDSLWSFLSSEKNDLVDLMDLCDRLAIPYVFEATGNETGAGVGPDGEESDTLDVELKDVALPAICGD